MDPSLDGVYQRVQRFFAGDIWRRELKPGSIADSGLRVLQFGVMVVEGFVRDQLLLRASALTYISILSIVPVLAIALNILRAIGVTENLAELAVDQIAAGLPDARERILDMVQGADLGSLGTIGAVILIATSVLALRHLESTLNDIWGVHQSRGWARRFADYLTVMIVAPLLTAAALSLATSFRSGSFVEWIETLPVLQTFYQFGLQRLPTLLAAMAFTFLYWFFPNTRVQFPAAAVGGVVAAVLFFVAQHFYLEFSVGAARYSVLFGAFSQLPLLLFWLYLSWAIILMGAEISFAYQNLAHYRREVRELPPGPAERESLGLRIAVRVAEAFHSRSPAPDAFQLSNELEASVRTVNGLIEELSCRGIITEVRGEDREQVFQLGRPAEDVSVADILVAIRGDRRLREPASEGRSSDVEACDRAVDRLLSVLDDAVGPVAGGRSLADLIASPDSAARAPDPHGAQSGQDPQDIQKRESRENRENRENR